MLASSPRPIFYGKKAIFYLLRSVSNHTIDSTVQEPSMASGDSTTHREQA